MFVIYKFYLRCCACPFSLFFPLPLLRRDHDHHGSSAEDEQGHRDHDHDEQGLVSCDDIWSAFEQNRPTHFFQIFWPHCLFACCCNALLTLERTPQCSIPLLFTDNSLPFRKGASVTGVHAWLPSLHFIVQIAMRLVTHSVFVICYYWKPPYK